MTLATPLATHHHIARLDAIDEILDFLRHELNQLIAASWGPADNASTAVPCADGTAWELSKRIHKLADLANEICEYRKDLKQPGQP